MLMLVVIDLGAVVEWVIDIGFVETAELIMCFEEEFVVT